MNNIGNRLKELRISRGWRQKDVAKKLNMTTQGYSNYERGKRIPNSYLISSLADIYNVSADFIVCRNTTVLLECTVENKYDDLSKVLMLDINKYMKKSKKFVDETLLDVTVKNMLINLCNDLKLINMIIKRKND